MGMAYSHEAQDVARIFQIRVSRGEFVQVGVDDQGLPLYIEAESLVKPFEGLSDEASRGLHAFSKPRILKK